MKYEVEWNLHISKVKFTNESDGFHETQEVVKFTYFTWEFHEENEQISWNMRWGEICRFQQQDFKCHVELTMIGHSSRSA